MITYTGGNEMKYIDMKLVGEIWHCRYAIKRGEVILKKDLFGREKKWYVIDGTKYRSLESIGWVGRDLYVVKELMYPQEDIYQRGEIWLRGAGIDQSLRCDHVVEIQLMKDLLAAKKEGRILKIEGDACTYIENSPGP